MKTLDFRLGTRDCSFAEGDELIIDNFAGGGGASVAIRRALHRDVDHAINHDLEALGMHRINHARTVHHCEDVFDVDPVKLTEGRRVGLGWFSPDCKHFSKAKGGKPLDKRIRGLVLVMLRWAAIGTRVMIMENVEEITTWGPLLHDRNHSNECACGRPCGRPDPAHKGRTWRAFLDAISTGLDPDHPDMEEILETLVPPETQDARLKTQDLRAKLVRGFGYKYDTREIRACDYGAPTIRKRLFGVFRCDGRPIVWPQPTHADPRTQDSRLKTQDLKPWRPIAECIDWNIPCPSIFLTRRQAKRRGIKCKRPLAKSTQRRVAVGVGRYVIHAEEPFVISVTHQGSDRIESITEPARTITGAHRGEKAIVKPELAPFVTEHANASTQRNFPADEPSRTLCAEVKRGHLALVAPVLAQYHSPKREGDERLTEVGNPLPTQTTEPRFALVATNLVKLRGDVETHSKQPSINGPSHTISAGGTHHALTVAHLAQATSPLASNLSSAFLAQHNTGVVGHAATEPASTISSKGSQQQLVTASIAAYYGTEKDGQAIDEPLRAATSKARFGVAVSSLASNPSPLSSEQIAGARRVAKFLRAHGIQFEGEFAMVGEFVIVDIGMRMLTPRELFRAQGFSDDYVIDRAWIVDPKTGEIKEVALTKEAQIRMCGNSVSPPPAEALVAANVPELIKPLQPARRISAPPRLCSSTPEARP